MFSKPASVLLLVAVLTVTCTHGSTRQGEWHLLPSELLPAQQQQQRTAEQLQAPQQRRLVDTQALLPFWVPLAASAAAGGRAAAEETAAQLRHDCQQQNGRFPVKPQPRSQLQKDAESGEPSAAVAAAQVLALLTVRSTLAHESRPVAAASLSLVATVAAYLVSAAATASHITVTAAAAHPASASAASTRPSSVPAKATTAAAEKVYGPSASLLHSRGGAQSRQQQHAKQDLQRGKDYRNKQRRQPQQLKPQSLEEQQQQRQEPEQQQDAAQQRQNAARQQQDAGQQQPEGKQQQQEAEEHQREAAEQREDAGKQQHDVGQQQRDSGQQQQATGQEQQEAEQEQQDATQRQQQESRAQGQYGQESAIEKQQQRYEEEEQDQSERDAQQKGEAQEHGTLEEQESFDVRSEGSVGVPVAAVARLVGVSFRQQQLTAPPSAEETTAAAGSNHRSGADAGGLSLWQTRGVPSSWVVTQGQQTKQQEMGDDAKARGEEEKSSSDKTTESRGEKNEREVGDGFQEKEGVSLLQQQDPWREGIDNKRYRCLAYKHQTPGPAMKRIKDVKTEQKCQRLCRREKECTHAVLNTDTDTCSLKVGFIEVQPSTEESVVIPYNCADCFYINKGLDEEKAFVKHKAFSPYACLSLCLLQSQCALWEYRLYEEDCRLFADVGVGDLVDTLGTAAGEKKWCPLTEEEEAELKIPEEGESVDESADSDWLKRQCMQPPHTAAGGAALETLADVPTADVCQKSCQQRPSCTYFDYDRRTKVCRLIKSGGYMVSHQEQHVSGPRTCTMTCFLPRRRISLREEDGDATTQTTETNSVMDCQVKCREMPSCRRFSYCADNKQCVLSRLGPSRVSPDTPDEEREEAEAGASHDLDYETVEGTKCVVGPSYFCTLRM